jgi:tryptophanyl-tRNA synthetase
LLGKNINNYFEPFRQKRMELAHKPEDVWDVLYHGATRARTIARQTMEEVRAAVGLPESKE